MEKSKEQQHNLLKTIIIVLSFFMAFGINVLGFLFVKDEGSFIQITVGELAQIAIIVAMILIWAKVFPRVFTGIHDFRFRKLTLYQVMMYLGIALISLMLVYRVLYWIRGGEANVTMVHYVESQTEFREDMLASIHPILIAPLLEEMCFRIIPASIIKTRKNKIVVLAVLAVAFAVCHTHNIFAALVDAIVFCILLLVTQNPLSSILCHAFNNFLKTLAIVLDYYDVINFSTSEGGGRIVLFSAPVTLAAIAIGVALILPSVLKVICKKNS